MADLSGAGQFGTHAAIIRDWLMQRAA